MKFAVDQIINNLAVLESLEEQIKKEVPLTELPKDIKEGTILSYENEVYKKEELLEQQRRKEIKNKFDMLRKKSG